MDQHTARLAVSTVIFAARDTGPDGDALVTTAQCEPRVVALAVVTGPAPVGGRRA